jgi:RNA polymerase sigma factor (sigma-70 family)
MKTNMARALTALRNDEITFQKFCTETADDWRKLSRYMLRRWEAPDGVEEIDVQQEMLIAAWDFLKKWNPDRGPTLDAYVVWNACDKAKKWLHKQRASLRRDGDAPSRHPVSLARLGLEEWQEDRLLSTPPDAELHAEQEAAERALLERVSLAMEQLDAKDRYVVCAILQAGGDLTEAAKDLWQDPQACRVFSIWSEAQARSTVRRAVKRCTSAA